MSLRSINDSFRERLVLLTKSLLVDTMPLALSLKPVALLFTLAIASVEATSVSEFFEFPLVDRGAPRVIIVLDGETVEDEQERDKSVSFGTGSAENLLSSGVREPFPFPLPLPFGEALPLLSVGEDRDVVGVADANSGGADRGTSGAFSKNERNTDGKIEGSSSPCFPTQTMRWKAMQNSFDVKRLSASWSASFQIFFRTSTPSPDLLKIVTDSWPERNPSLSVSYCINRS